MPQQSHRLVRFLDKKSDEHKYLLEKMHPNCPVVSILSKTLNRPEGGNLHKAVYMLNSLDLFRKKVRLSQKAQSEKVTHVTRTSRVTLAAN